MTRSYSCLFFMLSLLIGGITMLYHTSDRTAALDRDLRNINAQIEAEQESLHVLKAEWVFLSNPARIETEAQRHLGLQPTATRRVTAWQHMAMLLPLRDGGDISSSTMVAQAQQAAPAPKAASEPRVAQAAPRTRHDRIVASLNAGRVNDHMVMQHTAAVEASTDRIGALIGSLGLRP